jgi:sugar phosphate permease
VLGDIRGRAALVVLGGFVCQMGLAFGYVFGPLQIPITEDLGWSRTSYATAAASRIPLIALSTAAVGFLTVRIGARAVLTSACLIAGGTFFAMSRMQELWHLYALIPFLGMTLASFGDVTVGHVVMRWIRRGRGLALGIVYVGANVGRPRAGAMPCSGSASEAPASSSPLPSASCVTRDRARAQTRPTTTPTMSDQRPLAR